MTSREDKEVLAWCTWSLNPGELCWEIFPLGTPGWYRWARGPEKVYSLPVTLFFFSGQESCILSAELGEKCEAIDKKLLYLEDQLHTAVHSHDEDLIHILFILQSKHLLGCFGKASLKKILSFSMPQHMAMDTTVIYSPAHLRSLRSPCV